MKVYWHITIGFKMIINDNDKNKILDIHFNDSYPLGDNYFLKALNPISFLPYFYWWIVPFVAFLVLAYQKYSNNYINLRLTNFAKNLDGVISSNIIFIHDIYAVMSIFLLILFMVSIKNVDNDEAFKEKMMLLNCWLIKNEHPNSNFTKKIYVLSFIWILVVQTVFWIFYPSPTIRSIRLIMAENFFTHFLYLNFFLFSYILVLSSLLTTYGVRRYGMQKN